MKRTPRNPKLAYHRLILAYLNLSHKGYNPLPEEIDRIATVFSKAGGSWVNLFTGGVEATQLLQKVLLIAVEKKLLTKSPKW